ncbi:EAL domain-containing protein [Bosea sp. TWI1241]|uniref:putative bifunctional diguanylate cyclase/phosphodiesterase n=1 Tax=Bosea sp. TWI1241 TaxID=3148904 RepID=UPI00320793BF
MTRDGLFRFGGEFLDPVRETAFREARLAETLRQCRLLFLFSVVLNSLFLVSDWRFHGTPHFYVAIPARLLVVAGSIVALALLHHARTVAQTERVMVFWQAVTAGGIAVLVSSRSDLALFVVLLLPSIFYLVVAMSFRLTLTMGAMCSALMLIGYLGAGPYPETLPGLLLVVFLMNCALGLVVVHANRLRRTEWLATQAERTAKDALAVSQEMIERLFMAVPIPLVVAARDDGRFLRGNDAARRYFGKDLAERQIRDVLFDPEIRRRIDAVLYERDRIVGQEAQVLDAGGAVRDVLVTATTLETDDTPAVVAGIVDITDRKAAEARTRRQATHDTLTGLPNRLFFQERLREVLDGVAGPGGGACLFLIDLDDFKSVNDTLGHDAGDELLFQAAARLAARAEPEDFVARLGGDEFIVLTGLLLTPDEALAKAEGLLDALRAPCEHGGQTISPRASIGIALAPQHDEDAVELMKDADLALYRAKAEGRGIALVYEGSMRAAMLRRVAVCRGLASALLENRIEPFYQPQVDLETGRITGFEVLARWRHSERGIIPAAAFQEGFDDPEIAAGITDAIVAGTLRDLRSWLDSGHAVGHVSVNLAASVFRDAALAERLLARLDSAGVPTRHVSVEVTESVLLTRNADEAARVLSTLREAGLRVALDDFGTGYASLTHLRRFPVDAIKIDRSFVSHLEAEGEDAAIVRALVHLAADLGLEVIAEGIETEAQEAALRAFGCRIGQGYRYARPVPAGRVPWLLELPRLPAEPMRGGIVAA